MSYFNHSFQKIFIGTKPTTANSNQTTGFVTTAGIPTASLNNNTGVAATTYGVGSWGLFDQSTWNSVTTASIGATKPVLVLASASVLLTDKIGPFAGGYTETNKSKGINPKLVNRFLRIDPCTPRQQTSHVGSTKYTKTLSPSQSNCNFTFVCGETYNLRIELRNDPVYRFLQHNAIRLLEFNGGCCADGAPGATIDGTLAMIEWANQIINDPILKPFISPIVYSEAGVALYAPGTTGGVYTWDNYVSPGHVNGQYAGLRIQGSYIDTRFGTCSFEPTDYYGMVPVQFLVSMVDFNGDPCAYTGICFNTECGILEGEGLGDTILRQLILSESYRQNGFVTGGDMRLREIMEGNDILAAVDRATLYTRYVIQHNIPRNDNPTSVHSLDQYSLEIITNGTVATFETLMAAWLSNANSSVSLETTSCGTCTPLTP